MEGVADPDIVDDGAPVEILQFHHPAVASE